MHAAHNQFDIQAIQTSWHAFESITHLCRPHNEAEYQRMAALMNSLLDVMGITKITSWPPA